ncbi:hypothetical protein ACHAXN_004916 [Cyclotella atomus]
MKSQPVSAADESENRNSASKPAPPQHLHVDNAATFYNPAPQSPSPRHSSYALRKLSEEREKNKLLLQQLQQTTASPMRNDTYLNHIKELQKELQMETQRRIEAEQRAGHSLLYDLDDNQVEVGCHPDHYTSDRFVTTNQLLDRNNNEHRIDYSEHCSSVKHLIQRANHLLEANNSDNMRDEQLKLLTYEAETTTNELMKEFQSLLEAFYVEQRQNDASKDVIWLFEELEWRFEEIKRGYEEERLNWISSSINEGSTMQCSEAQNVDMTQWRACLKDLVAAVQNQSMGDIHPATSISAEEVTKLQQQLSSLNLMHTQKCAELNREMEAIQQSHRDDSAKMSNTIQTLQSQITQQHNFILRLKQEKAIQEGLIQEERQHFHVNSESMAARIRYLEEIVRSSNALASPIARGICTQQIQKLQSNGSMESEQDTPPIGDTAQPMSLHHNDTPPFASAPVLEYFKNADNQTDNNLIACLRQEIKELGNALEESEEERAKAIEEFQVERDGHIRQYEELSAYVKQLLDSDAFSCNGNNQV